MSNKLILIISVMTAACGQLLFKKGMMTFNPISIPEGFPNIIKLGVRIFFSPYILSGSLAYFASTILWLYALSKTELSYAYPFTTLTFILVMTASFFLFSEALTLNKIIGGVIICAGVLIISMK